MRLLLCLVLIAACSLPRARPDRSSFFTLSAADVDGAGAPSASDLVIGLGPVSIPGYLDRPELVTRVGANELRLASSARWAEPLREGIVRTLALDVGAASGASHVTVYPWASATHVDVVVGVDVVRFEPQADGDAELVARWTVREGLRGRVLIARESRVREPVDGKGSGADVAALSRALGTFGKEIGLAVRAVRTPRPDAAR